ncbi:MAG: PHP domain-containing protein [Anaerolineae bacterium]|nr:PHP domain-containing protein [Anaerolineae bacterium]
MRVDLHIHSTASDGTWNPRELVQQVQATGIDLFAVADHDSVGNVRATEALARERGLHFIRAVEVSSTWNVQLIHILGYGIDLNDAALLAMIDENWHRLASVDDQSIRKLIAAGYEISFEEFETYQNDTSRGGWKALNFMIDKGICSGVKDFFGRLFVGEMALHYPAFADPAEAVQIIHRAGGTAIWAHPGSNVLNGRTADEIFDYVRDIGIDGLECYTPYHDAPLVARCLDFCRQHGLLITAGSDCHGGFVAERALGQPEARLSQLNLGPLLGYARIGARP